MNKHNNKQKNPKEQKKKQNKKTKTNNEKLACISEIQCHIPLYKLLILVRRKVVYHLLIYINLQRSMSNIYQR
jgi:hypothetical protein